MLALLLEQSSEEMPTPPPRSNGKEGRNVFPPVQIIASLQEMDEFEKEKMKKSRPVVESRLSRLHKWLDDYVPKTIKKAVTNFF